MMTATVRQARSVFRKLSEAFCEEYKLRAELKHGTVTPSRAAELQAAVTLAQAAVAKAIKAWNAASTKLTAEEIRHITAVPL